MSDRVERPPPLVPPECTMAGNDWYPFYEGRMTAQETARRAPDGHEDLELFRGLEPA